MPKQVASALERLRRTADGMSLAQKIFLSLLAGLLVVAVVFLMQWTSKPTMAPLFTNLSTDDAAAIVAQLDSSGVQYQLTAGGSTIMVPQDQLYDTRLAVASAGLPSDGGVGYELLDNMSMTSSEFQQQVTYQRALEGELAKTIQAMDGVETASVKLAIPQDTVFADQKDKPTASVFVATKPGSALGTQNVQAIANLVSASIEGMSADDVAVIGADGVVLSTVGAEDSSIQQASATADYESRIASNVQQMLDQIVGPGNAVVSVTAELDYDQTQTTSETFSSDPSAKPLSESQTTEAYTGDGSNATGVLGPDNISVPAASASAGAYSSEEWVRNNAVNKVTEITQSAPGTVRRQSVSVVTNSAVASSINQADLESMVAAAAGVDTTRGDVLSVSTMAFDTTQADTAAAAITEAQAEQQSAATKAMIVSISKWAVVGLIALVLIIIVMVRSRRRTNDERVQLSLEAVEELEARAQAALDARSQALIDAASAEATGDLFALEAAPVPDMDSVALAIREEITAFAEQQPAEVAEVLRGWISSGERR
ncbi:flagellar basal-body MS-ring/collar protein FliF [Demequina capsici]|uniref:Flagellar M-ring protein n=1 Tax=Demequina capsici TaxID=3075620 RepID=A0AA96JAW8_9MICO|nr:MULTISPECIES: flagellar basal-body MS-ring/collar protein FliF [unclassified Demequina]WNM24552.1 flagellar basal-body MS-ring/collar protein FliF [Demequina sp. OYTSA14]WNM27403.1 flagellar basal-body MS-ring/collar protein FliF [Demequina sp. PMTSA13]